jgi:hypothetical protein
MLDKTPQLQTLNPILKQKLIAGDPVKVPRALISAPGEENPYSTVEHGFSSELVDFSAKFKN